MYSHLQFCSSLVALVVCIKIPLTLNPFNYLNYIGMDCVNINYSIASV